MPLLYVYFAANHRRSLIDCCLLCATNHETILDVLEAESRLRCCLDIELNVPYRSSFIRSRDNPELKYPQRRDEDRAIMIARPSISPQLDKKHAEFN